MHVHLRPPISSWQRYRRDRCKERCLPITSSNWTVRKQKPEIPAAPGVCSAKLEVRNHGPLGTANNGVLPIRRGETERQAQGHVLAETWSLSSFCWRRLKSGSSVDGVATWPGRHAYAPSVRVRGWICVASARGQGCCFGRFVVVICGVEIRQPETRN